MIPPIHLSVYAQEDSMMLPIQDGIILLLEVTPAIPIRQVNSIRPVAITLYSLMSLDPTIPPMEQQHFFQTPAVLTIRPLDILA